MDVLFIDVMFDSHIVLENDDDSIILIGVGSSSMKRIVLCDRDVVDDDDVVAV